MLTNKKVTYMICFYISIVLMLLLTCSYEIGNAMKEGGGMVVYSVDSNIFRQFISNPSLEVLNKHNSGITVQSFIVSSDKDKYIKRETKKDDIITIDEAKSGVMRIGSLPVYVEFLEFLKEKSNLEVILKKNGIYDIIDYYCIIDNQSSSKVPLSIWIKTNSDNYFLTIDECLEDYAENPNNTDFVYRCYTHADYCKKFGLRDGSLVVNGENITASNYVKFENDTVYLPFRAIIEKLGFVVEWDEKNYWATFSGKDSVQYVLRLNAYPNLVAKSNVNNLGHMPPGEDLPFCAIIDNRIVVDERLMQDIAAILCFTVNIDYENLTVAIN